MVQSRFTRSIKSIRGTKEINANVAICTCLLNNICTVYKVENVGLSYFRTATNVPKKRRVDDESPARELGETERPDVKYTPQHKRKEKLEDKMIEFIDLTTKQSVAELAPPPPAAPPVPKDYVGSQLEAIGPCTQKFS